MDERYADAETHFLETLRKQPGIERVRELLGFIAMREGRHEEALAYYEAERRLFGSTPPVEDGIRRARDPGMSVDAP